MKLETADGNIIGNTFHQIFLESQQTFLDCIFESRLRGVTELPPPGDKTVVLAMKTLRPHEAMALAYYLNNLNQVIDLTHGP